jgi:diguanylate cyclase
MAEPAADWKTRYRDLVRDFEAKEREWTELETALRAAASRVAVAAMGQSEELDAALGPLVDSLRTKGALPQLDTSSTSLVRALKVHEATAQKHVLPDLAKLIAGLVRALGRVPGFASAEAALAERIAAGVGPDGWSSLLDDIARDVARVVDSLRTQRNELQDFLDQVTRQLALLEAWASWNNDAAQSRREETDDLEHSVEIEMAQLLRDVDESPDIGAIKSKVQARLDSVTRQLEVFRQSEERRSAESEQRSAALKQEVERLKTRTTELSEIVAAQEKRLMLDPLTATHSRYAYEHRIKEEHQRWQRHRHPLTYSIWDLDGFKRINDQLGHEAGDRLLRAVAEIMSRNKRELDFLARLGGEEFVLLLPATSLGDGLKAAEKIRVAIEAATFQHKGAREKVTISCGVTEFREGDTPEVVYERADRALYEAKQQGRNRCVPI